MLSAKRSVRKKRVRGKVAGTVKCPRLSVYRSNKYVYAQLIDDENQNTIVSARGVDAKVVGAEVAKLAKKNKIMNVVFDRSGYKYHGKVKILADEARKGGLKF